MGIRPWNLTRSHVPSTVDVYDKDLASAFSKYKPEDFILLKISLLMEHFCETVPTEMLVTNGTILRDFRPNPRSLFLPVPKIKDYPHELICEAYRSDADAHQGILDC
ncbi:hypothetical protein [Chlamydia sp. 17-3921]|uniref:hypothetical protein n=1 Tax=Chlamydia sp. 17-3921 TaxID=2675798 RepID=UPI00191A688F|nr:hypothetical protein [Chlamydia sp. 17-3921]